MDSCVPYNNGSSLSYIQTIKGTPRRWMEREKLRGDTCEEGNDS